MGGRHGLLIGALALAGCGRVAFDATTDAGDLVDAFLCATPVNHDEDGDTIDDGCDLCPLTAGASNADTDSDGVGDLCDPEPALGRQRLVLFESFVSPAASWATDADYIPDAVRLGVSGGNLYNGNDVNNVDIHLVGVISSVHATVQNHFYLAVERNSGIKWYAELVEDPGGTERRFTLMYYNGGSYDPYGNQDLTTPFAPSPIDWHYQVRATGDATSSVTMGTQLPTVSGTFLSDVSYGESLHMFVGGMQIDITGMFVVETE